MIGLHALIAAELAKRGWKTSDLVAQSALSKATLSRIKTIPDYRPDLETLVEISIALDIPLRRVVESCGYVVDSGVANQDEDQRIMALLRAVPNLRVFLEPLGKLKPADRQTILAVAEQLASQYDDDEE